MLPEEAWGGHPLLWERPNQEWDGGVLKSSLAASTKADHHSGLSAQEVPVGGGFQIC